MTVESRLLDQLRLILSEHRSRLEAIDYADPLASSTVERTNTYTRTLLRNLKSTTPIDSSVADEIDRAEQELLLTR